MRIQIPHRPIVHCVALRFQLLGQALQFRSASFHLSYHTLMRSRNDVLNVLQRGEDRIAE
jgi:hypothetical protein